MIRQWLVLGPLRLSKSTKTDADPRLSPVRSKKFAWYDATGKLVTGTIEPNSTLDIPVGGLAGGFIALSPGLRIDHGEFGLVPPKDPFGMVPGGTHFSARFLMCGLGRLGRRGKTDFCDADPPAFLTMMGFGPTTPYELKLTRGTLKGLAFPARAAADQFGSPDR